MAVTLRYLVISFLFVSVSHSSECLSGRSPDGISFINFKPDEYSYLNISSIGSDLVEEGSECGFSCLEIPSCFSYNLAAVRDINNKKLCELLPSDKYNNTDKFNASQVFHHFSIPSPCSRWPCQNNGACVSQYEKNSYVCLCTKEYSGKHCQTNLTSINECQSNPCLNNGTCSDQLGGFNCSCVPGFKGDRCETTAFSAVFKNLGASGRYGPTTLGSHYTGQDHDGQVTLSSGIQQWTVPYTNDYRIEAVGAAGGYDTGSNSAQYRGRGARMIGTFSLSKGEIIQILVGQEGGINSVSSTAGGGGGTFVVRGSNTPLVIAGGGGGVEGPSSTHAGCDASANTTGNPGYRSWSGGSSGHGAQTADSSNSGGGGGGFFSNGRSSKQFGGSMGYGGEGGRGFLQGGVGGRARSNNAVGGFGGGGGAYGSEGGAGGGGGYSGGSSGDNEVDSCGGGGGSYNAGTNQQNECCHQTAGHGHVTITLL